MGKIISKCSNTIDLEKAVALMINHRDEKFVKQILVYMMEEYAKTTDNTIDDKFVNMFRERLNVDNEVLIRFDGYDRY
jgi:hypothetical protein